MLGAVLDEAGKQAFKEKDKIEHTHVLEDGLVL